MSFLDSLVGLGKSTAGYLKGSGLGNELARTALLGLALTQVARSVNKQNSRPDAANSTQPDRFVREQLSPDTNHSIPVVYGSAFTQGIITDAVLSNDKKTMWFCVTICEKTGTLLSNNSDSVITFEEIWWNKAQVILKDDNKTIDRTIDPDGVVNSDVSGLVEIYLYNNGSNSPTFLSSSTGNAVNATSVFPNWTASHTMSGLVFAIVKITYNKERRVTNLGDWSFKLKNTMTQPGDCVYDYMTNTRYGAGIPDSRINK